MRSKELLHTAQFVGRRAAIRQELLPSHLPLPKPTRDISANNRSQSIINHDPPLPFSDRRILDRQAEEFEYEKQANIVYTRQFKILAKLLGNQTMEFDQLKLKVERLILKDTNHRTDSEIRHKIQALEQQLARKDDQKGSQFLSSNSEYFKAMETELGRKNKLITELSDSIKRQTFQEAYKSLQLEVSTKDKALQTIEEQMHEVRLKSANQIGSLQEELIKRNQTVQKMTFEIDSLKRKFQTSQEEGERTKKREKDLLSTLETETRVTYQGVTYSINSLFLQLQSRDKELNEALEQQKNHESQAQQLKQLLHRYQNELETLKQEKHNFEVSYTQKINLLEQKIYKYEEEQITLKKLLDEATDKESHFEAEIQAQAAQIIQLKAEIQMDRQQATKEKNQINQKLQILHEQLQHQKNMYDDSVSKRTQLQQDLHDIQINYKNFEQNRQHLQDQLLITKKENSHLQTKLAQLERNLSDQRINWLTNKNLFTSEIEQQQSQVILNHNQFKAHILNIQIQYEQKLRANEVKQNQLQHDCQSLTYEKQHLQTVNAELRAEREQYLAKVSSGNQKCNELQNLSFNYYSREGEDNYQHLNDVRMKQREDLPIRIEEENQKQDNINNELIFLKQNYQHTLKELENKNHHLNEQLNKFQSELQKLKNQNKLQPQNFIQEKQNYQKQIHILQEELTAFKNKEVKLNEEVSEFTELIKEIQILKEQVLSIRKECQQIGQARRLLQIRNNQLQVYNKQLQALVKRQSEGEEQNNLSKLSKQSNASGTKEMKKEDYYSQSPSNYGELSRKILNQDFSKISGQESKFTQHQLVSQNSKIQVVKEAIQHGTLQRVEVKEKKNEEPILNKIIQQKEKSINSPSKQGQDRISQTSPKKPPKQTPPGEKSAPQKKIENQSVSDNRSQASISNFIPKVNNQSQSSHQSNKSNLNKNNEVINSMNQPDPLKQMGYVPNGIKPSQNQTERMQYLPQNSSRKASPSNEAKKLELNGVQFFQKKQNIGTIPPVYIARPRILENYNDNRNNSTSRSNSKKKVTITYGQPSDRSIQIKNNNNIISDNTSEASRKIAIISMTPLINPTRDISPIAPRGSKLHQSPNQLMSSNKHQYLQNSQKPLKDSIIQPLPQKDQSESFINKINYSRFSGHGNGRQSMIQNSTLLVVKESPPSYIPPKLDNLYSPRQSNVIFNVVRSPNNFNYTSNMNSSTYMPTPQPPKAKIKKEYIQIDQTYNKQTVPEFTPIKVNMKKLSNGRNMNSGVVETLTFGGRSVRQESDGMSSASSDSGIEVMQYDWTAPCCNNRH